jgi:hypothetical protein
MRATNEKSNVNYKKQVDLSATSVTVTVIRQDREPQSYKIQPYVKMDDDKYPGLGKLF